MTTATTLYNRYSSKAYTHNYTVGFMYKKYLYVLSIEGGKLQDYLSMTQASRGDGQALRFRPNLTQKSAMIELGAKKHMTLEQFTQYVAETGYNKGESFEKYLIELDGQEWEKDSTPFWQAGDANINGVEVQIKFEGATFSNEKSLDRIGV